MKSLAKLALLALPALIFASGCAKEEGFGTDGTSSSVKFLIGGNPYQTKAAIYDQMSEVYGPIDLSDETGIEGLTLVDEVSSLDDLYSDVAMTKSTPIFTENISSIYTQLAVTAYSGTDTWGKTNVLYDYTEDYNGGKVYEHNYSAGTADGNLGWPSDGKLLFFLKAPVEDAGRSDITYNAEENYIWFRYKSPETAADQKDILFSSKHITESTNSLDNNRVLLYHALTGVKFKLKNVEGNDVSIVSIDKVTFDGILSEGICTITPSYEGGSFNTSNQNNGVNKSADVSIWTDRSTPAAFSQAFTSSEQGVSLINEEKYPESFNGSSANGTGNLNDANATKTFMFIPQQMTENITLTIEYKYKVGTDGATQTAKTTINFGQKLFDSLPEGTSEYWWKAGELHTYTLQLGDTVDVVIDDDVNTTTQKKSNLSIKNTGSATSYIRVAAIGNWFSDLTEAEIEKNIPVAITKCPELKDLVIAKYNSTDWIYSESDGFFYYKYPVAGGKTITNAHTLFQTLDLSGLVKPYNNCHLEVVFPVQAVRATDFRLWTNTTSPWDWAAVQTMKANTETKD